MSITTRKIEARDLSRASQREMDEVATKLRELAHEVAERDCSLVVRINGEELELDEKVHELVRLATKATLLYEAERLRRDCFLDNSATRNTSRAYISALEVVHPLGERFPDEKWLQTIPWRVEIVEST